MFPCDCEFFKNLTFGHLATYVSYHVTYRCIRKPQGRAQIEGIGALLYKRTFTAMPRKSRESRCKILHQKPKVCLCSVKVLNVCKGPRLIAGVGPSFYSTRFRHAKIPTWRFYHLRRTFATSISILLSNIGVLPNFGIGSLRKLTTISIEMDSRKMFWLVLMRFPYFKSEGKIY